MKHQIIDKCSEALFQAIEVDHALNGSASHSATAVVHTKDGCIELYIDCYGAQASVVHKREANNTHTTSPRSKRPSAQQHPNGQTEKTKNSPILTTGSPVSRTSSSTCTDKVVKIHILRN